jgi:enamine deaminase RidA (YjgF/YER057c/UK114 family)
MTTTATLEALAKLDLEIPAVPARIPTFEPWMQVGNLITTSFQMPWKDGALEYTGRLGADVTVEQGYDAARLCALVGLAQLQDAAGDLDRVRLVRVEGHVGCVEGFASIPQVLNGASELFLAVLGDRGRHARTALGHMVMPMNVPVMIGLWAEVLP